MPPGLSPAAQSLTGGLSPMRRLLYASAHSILEYDELDLFHSLGFEVASLGGYIDPSFPHDGKRPPLPHIPAVPVVREAVDAFGVADNLAAAQAAIPPAILDWLGTDGIIMYHALPPRLFGQWYELGDFRKHGGRIIWRSIGQSDSHLEQAAGYYRAQG